MHEIKFGVGVVPCRPIPEVVAAIKRAEAMSFDVAWVADSQLLYRDCYATLAQAAMNTETITLASAVSTATRHTSVLANQVATVAELAPDRFIMGFGSGESAMKLIGRKPSRLAEMRAEIDMVRSLLGGDSVSFGDHDVHMRAAQGRVPIYLAANGPKTTNLGGQVADGVIALGSSTPELIRRSRADLVAGHRAAGRNDPLPELVVGSFCKITDDIERDARWLKPICYWIALGAGGREHLRSVGIEFEGALPLPDVYPDIIHAEDWDAAIRFTERFVTDEMAVRFAEACCLFGSVDQVVERIVTAIDAGATSFFFRHLMSYSLPDELVETFGGEVIPRVREVLADRAKATGTPV